MAEARPVIVDRLTEDPRTFDGMVTNFVMALTYRRPEKLKEIQVIMKPESSTLDMFRFLWGLKEAHFKLTPPIFISTKSDEKSFIYWRLGNTHLNRKDKDLALKYFNLSIQIAPHPPYIVDDKVLESNVEQKKDDQEEDDPDCHSPEGWGDYVCLAYAYEARACLLLDMNQYKKCIRDIDLVLQLGCPPVTVSKLKHMKKICIEEFNHQHDTSHPGSPSRKGAAATSPPASPSRRSESTTSPPASPSRRSESTTSPTASPSHKSVCTESPPVSFKYRCPDPPTLVDPNPTIPAFTSSVKLAYNKDMGRHIVATKNLSHGEIVAVEEGYCHTIRLQYLRTYCVVCLKRTLAPLPCPSCTMAVFCGERCRVQGLANIHWQECHLLNTLLQLDMGANPLLALKLFLKNSHTHLRKIIPQVMAEVKSQPPERRGFNSEGVYDHTNYRTVYNLVTNKERRGYKNLFNRAMEAFVILKLLHNGGKYFRDSEGNSVYPSEEDLIFTGSLLMHHMMNLGCNAAGICEVEIVGKEVDSNPIRFYGASIFPTISLMSHSCYPTCVVLSFGRYRVVKACRAIPAGAQVTCQYIDALKGNLMERRARLLHQYFFLCRCEACEMNWPEGLQYTSSFNLKCVRCLVVVNANTKKCSQCNLYYTKRSAVPGSPHLVTYEYNLIRKKVDQALKDYKRAEHRLIKKGNESEADMRNISNLIELYDEFVELPAFIHVSAQSTYNSMSYMHSSSAYSIEDSNPQCSVS